MHPDPSVRSSGRLIAPFGGITTYGDLKLQKSCYTNLDDLGTSGKYSREPVLKPMDPIKLVGVFNELEGVVKYRVRATLEKRCEFNGKDLTEALPFCKVVLVETERISAMHTGLVTPSSKNLDYLKADVGKIVGLLEAASVARSE